MRYSTVALVLPVASFISGAYAQDYHFDAALLGNAAKDVDLSLFNQGLQQPGTYHFDIMLNGEQIDSKDILLQLSTNSDNTRTLSPCISLTMLSGWGVKTDAFPGLTTAPGNAKCVRIAAIPQATVTADILNQQLRLNIPQADLRPHFDGLAPEILWDDGVTAFRMNYSAGSSHTISRDITDTYSWAQLQPGFNFGPWRFRSDFSGQNNQWRRSYVYAERGLNNLKSRLTLGERTTAGDVFNGVPFTGVMLGTDEEMIPSSARNFAPEISGVARTRARVEVRQNGYVLKTLSVPAGPFAIQNLPTSGGGDMQVTVYEADGRIQMFTVPWQTPAVALHAGYLKYSITAGRYRSADKATLQLPLVQSTAIYGLPHGLTIYGGLQAAKHYSASLLGVGASLGRLGAISTDATGARSQLPGLDSQQGVTWRLRYSNQLSATGTIFSLASWQYASQGYRSMTETLDNWQRNDQSAPLYSSRRLRTRSTLSLSQSLGEAGSISLNETRTDWRNVKGHDDRYGLSWSRSVYGASMSMNWQQSQTRSGDKDRTLSMWLTVPFSNGINASWNMTAPNPGAQSQEIGLDGRSMDDRLAWDIRQSWRTGVPHDQKTSSNLGLGWNGTYGQADMNYSYSPSSKQLDADVSGGVIVNHSGMILSQPLSDTVALVSAPGAAGVKVIGWPGVRTDLRGYTTASGLMNYQENTISLDPTSLPDDADVPQTDVKVVPSQGAVVQASFHTLTGARGLVTVLHPDGKAINFGSQVTVEGVDGNTGLSDEKGLVYLSGLPQHGILRVRTNKSVCRADYRLPKNKNTAGLYEFSTVCRPASVKNNDVKE